jgi:hypothetical protein
MVVERNTKGLGSENQIAGKPSLVLVERHHVLNWAGGVFPGFRLTPSAAH